jgi:hypothetical protein
LFITYIFLELIVNSIQLSIGSTLCEERLFEKLRENIQSFRELIVFDIKVIIGVVLTCRCILSSTMLLDEF